MPLARLVFEGFSSTDESGQRVCAGRGTTMSAESPRCCGMWFSGDPAGETDKRYRLYAPGESAAKWEEFQTAGIMAISWARIGNLAAFSSVEEIIDALESRYEDWGGHPTQAAGMSWDFIHTVRPGGVVYARYGLTELVGRGIIYFKYRYDDNRASYRSVRDVE